MQGTSKEKTREPGSELRESTLKRTRGPNHCKGSFRIIGRKKKEQSKMGGRGLLCDKLSRASGGAHVRNLQHKQRGDQDKPGEAGYASPNSTEQPERKRGGETRRNITGYEG